MKELATAQAKEETAHGLRATDVGAPATLGSFACTIGEDDGGTPGPACTFSGNRSGQAALRRKQQKQFGSNHHENQATGKKGETDQTSKAQPSEKKIWWYTCRLRKQCGM
jgi:hypothetical protein